MKAVIFAGPSLRPSERPRGGPSIEWRGPAQRGCVYQAARQGFSIIGLVDGHFRTAPAVLHKEILWVIREGCAVYGAASMGALRAAELHAFGMAGVGTIYEDYVSGRLTRDDEVAIEHGPAELDYFPLSDALVDIRYSLAFAASRGVISHAAETALLDYAASRFYASRRLRDVVTQASSDRSVGHLSADALDWIIRNRCYRKRDDALELLAVINSALLSCSPPVAPGFDFQETTFFADFRASIDNPLVRDFAT